MAVTFSWCRVYRAFNSVELDAGANVSRGPFFGCLVSNAISTTLGSLNLPFDTILLVPRTIFRQTKSGSVPLVVAVLT